MKFAKKAVFLFVLFLAHVASPRQLSSQDPVWHNMGPYMGFIHCMDMDYLHPDTLYSGTATGVFRSVDGAGQWTRISDLKQEIRSLEVYHQNPDYLLYTTDSAVYFSNDYGESWSRIWKKDSMKVSCATFNPLNPSSIYVGTNEHIFDESTFEFSYTEGIYHSPDGGLTWEEKLFYDSMEDRYLRMDWVNRIVVDPSDTSIIYVAGKNDSQRTNVGVFTSHDQGNSWFPNRFVQCSNEEVTALACTPEGYGGHCVSVLVDNKCEFSGRQLFLSRDSGMTWNEAEVFSGFSLGDTPLFSFPDQPEWLYMAASYENSSIAAYHLEEESWYYYPGTPAGTPSSILSYDGNDYLGFERDGVYAHVLPDSAWIRKNRGFSDVEILDIVPFPGVPDLLFAALRGSLLKTSDRGEQWRKLEGAGTWINTVFVLPSDTSKLLAGVRDRYDYPEGADFSIMKSASGGLDWEPFDLFRVDGIFDYYRFWNTRIVGSPDDPDEIYLGVDGGGGGAGEGFYRSVDGGDNWDNTFETGVSAIAVDPVNNDMVYLGTSGYGYVRRSVNRGISWQSISPAGPDEWVTTVRDLAVDKFSNVLAATTSGLLKWEGEENWSQVQGIPTEKTRCIAIDNEAGLPVYYVGTEEMGVYYSTDLGESWLPYGTQDFNTTRLVINDSEPRHLYAGTKSAGVWWSELVENETPVEHDRLNSGSVAAYPNPTDGPLRVDAMGFSGSIRILMVNAQGMQVCSEEVRNLGDAVTLEMDLSGYPQGLYLLVVTDQQRTVSRSVVVH